MIQKCIRLLHETAIPQIDELFGFETGAFAIDVFGGVFCFHNTVYYFAPDVLEFENLNISKATWDVWVKTKQANLFYKAWRWKGMGNDLRKLKKHEGFLIYPPLWAKECNIETASKKPMHLLLVVSAELELRQSLRQLQEDGQIQS